MRTVKEKIQAIISSTEYRESQGVSPKALRRSLVDRLTNLFEELSTQSQPARIITFQDLRKLWDFFIDGHYGMEDAPESFDEWLKLSSLSSTDVKKGSKYTEDDMWESFCAGQDYIINEKYEPIRFSEWIKQYTPSPPKIKQKDNEY